jgi:hypothetical protein
MLQQEVIIDQEASKANFKTGSTATHTEANRLIEYITQVPKSLGKAFNEVK